MGKTFKCMYCEKRLERAKLIAHIDKTHEELIPEGYDGARLVYDMVNKKVDSCGYCRVCHKPTEWNPKLAKYDVLCDNPKCKEQLRENYKRNMLRVKGTYNILNDPEQQKIMLANRRISGVYKHSDGGKIQYTGEYERKFLEFMDLFMQMPSKDIISPGPTMEYTYNGTKHIYIPDFYIPSINCIIEVKDGGDNLNNKQSASMIASREKTLEKERIVTDRGEYNYIRLTNNQFEQMIDLFMNIKLKIMNGDDTKTIKINESYDEVMANECFVNESLEDVAAILLGKRKIINNNYIALYHGSVNGNLKTIIPRSYNLGTRDAKPKMSSFWFNDPRYAITFATLRLLSHYKDRISYTMIDNDMKLLVLNKYKDDVLEILANNTSYVYEKIISTKYVGYGHSGTFPEYTLDIPVVPDHVYKMDYEKMLTCIKFVSENYFKYIHKAYVDGKMSFGANKFQQIAHKLFYYANDTDRLQKRKSALNNNRYVPMTLRESEDTDNKF